MSAAQENIFLALTGLKNKSFSLLWRGSRDGFNVNEFHRLCDGKANTVTVIKNTNGFIFSGFASIPWSSSDDGQKEIYLFSLTNPKNTPLKIKVIPQKIYVKHDSIYGPTFGTGSDLRVSSLSNTNRNSYMIFSAYKFPYGTVAKKVGNSSWEAMITISKLLKSKFLKLFNFFHCY